MKLRELFLYRNKKLKGSVTGFIFISMITILTLVLLNGKIVIINGRKSLDEEIVNMIKDKEKDIEFEYLHGEINNIIASNNILTKEELREYLTTYGFNRNMYGYSIKFNKDKGVFTFNFHRGKLNYDFEINDISKRVEFLLTEGANEEADFQ